MPIISILRLNEWELTHRRIDIYLGLLSAYMSIFAKYGHKELSL